MSNCAGRRAKACEKPAYPLALEARGFAAGFNTYHQLCAPLARQLAAEGPAYLPHLLGLIAYAYGPDCDQAKPGAVVYPAARDRELADPRYLPPPTLDFEQALAWAIRGGREEKPVSAEVSEPEATEEAELADPPHEPTFPERAWTATLARLQLELSRDVFNTWLQGVTLVSADEATFKLGVRDTYARDWLENRLRDTIKRALGDVVGHAVEVEFVLQPAKG